MSNLRKLWRLQILEEQQKNTSGLAQNPTLVAELKNLKKAIESSQLALKELKHKHSEGKQQINMLAAQAQEIKDKINAVNTKIYGGTLHTKEINMHQQRGAKLNKELQDLEDQELGIMQVREDIKEDWERQHQQLKQDTEKYKEMHHTYLQIQEEEKSRLEGIARELADASRDISGDLLNQYQQLKKKYANPVGRVTKDSCSGCHIGVSFDVLKKLKSEEVVYCNNCGRILFYDPE